MSFWKGTSLENGTLTRLEPLRLSGEDGLIARFITTLQPEQTARWRLDSASFLQTLGESAGLLLFRPSQSPGPDGEEYYQIRWLQGTCENKQTDIVLEYIPKFLRFIGQNAYEILPAEETRPFLCEAISLSGGTQGGTWRWVPPPIKLGAVVLGT